MDEELHVHIIDDPASYFYQRLKQEIGTGICLSCSNDIPPDAAFDVLVSGRPTREWLQASARLRAVIVPYAGVPPETLSLIQSFPNIRLYNLHHNASMTAEFALGLLFAAAKSIIPLDKALRDGDWRKRFDPENSILLEGKTALILGYGEIGKRIARVLKALAMDVIAVRRECERYHDDFALVYPISSLDSLLPFAQILMITLPLTKETENLIDQRRINLLPDDAILVNVGRGRVVNEEALYRALSGGKLRAAGIDVWYQYPKHEKDREHTFPSRFPIHELPNVVMSPHRGGFTRESDDLRVKALIHLLEQIQHGNVDNANMVDLAREY